MSIIHLPIEYGFSNWSWKQRLIEYSILSSIALHEGGVCAILRVCVSVWNDGKEKFCEVKVCGFVITTLLWLPENHCRMHNAPVEGAMHGFRV